MLGSLSKEALNQRAARVKAQRQRVYISSLQGHYPLEVGVAYHYRGHFIYAYPAGNPIEPIPFSTRRGISFVGTVKDRAPIYNPRAADLVPENNIAALQRACHHEEERQKQQENASKLETADALDQEAEHGSDEVNREREKPVPNANELIVHQPESYHTGAAHTTLTSHSKTAMNAASSTSLTSLALHSHRTVASLNVSQISIVQSPSMASVTATAPYTDLEAYSYTPHDRAQYLSASAPGSRHASVTNTPHSSRPVSPTHDPGRGSLRPIASTSRLIQLLADAGIRRTFSPLQDVTEGRTSHVAAVVLNNDLVANLPAEEWIDPKDIDVFVQTVSRPVSRPWSRSNTPPLADDMNKPLYLPGLGHCDGSRLISRMESPCTSNTHEDDADAMYLRRLGRCGMSRSSNSHAAMQKTHRDVPNQGQAYPVASSTLNLSKAPSAMHIHAEIATENQFDTAHRPPFTHQAASTGTHDISPEPTAALTQEEQEQSNVTAHIPFPSFRETMFRNASPPPLSDLRHFPLHTGRSPASSSGRPCAASLALNTAYNAVNPPARPFGQDEESMEEATQKCLIHDETCDGVSVTNKHLTEQARQYRGFKDLYPTITVGDRTMIDWEKLRDDEMAKMSMGV